MAFPSIDIGANPLDSLSPTFAQSAPPATPGGMFGGGGASWQNALLAALAGFMARRNPSVSNNLINGLQSAMELKQKIALAQQQHQQEFQDARLAHQQDRQFDIANPIPQQPSEFETRLQQSGVKPGTQEWTAAMQAAVQNVTDPVIMTPYGPVTRSQALGAGAKPLTDADIDRLGGQTPSASGGFPGY